MRNHPAAAMAAALVTACVVWTLPMAGVAVAAPPPGGALTHAAPGTVPPADERVASAAARAAGQPVEVTAARSQTQQVFANPDGTFTARVSARPVRIKRADGSWVPVDTTLRMHPDGSVRPGA